MTVTPGLAQTPFLAGDDPFGRFPKAGQTSTGTPEATPFGHDEDRRAVTAALDAVIAVMTPTALSQPSLAGIMRSLADRFQVTRANIQELLPLLGFGSLPQQSAELSALTAAPGENAPRALAATADLTTWLGMTEEQVADIAGFSRRNYSNWRSGQGSYPKTVRGLFEIHALVGGLVRALGVDEAMSWLALPGAGGDSRQQLLTTSTGRARLMTEAHPLLFARIDRERPTAEFETEDVDVTSAAQRSTAEALIGTPPRRRRRPV
jgi:hypothetical protein